MRIGVYVSVAAVRQGYERNVSGHVQIPLHFLKLLRDAGHDAVLITTNYDEAHTLPECMPAGAPVQLVEDARTRGSVHHAKGHVRPGVRLGGLRRQLGQIRDIALRERLDVLHLFGMNRTAHMGGLLRFIGVQCPIVCTVFHADAPERFGAVKRQLWRRCDAILTATEFVQRRLAALGVNAQIVRHGVVRDLRRELGDEPVGVKRRVLFWRDPSFNNGADICAQAFDALAPQFRDFSFDFAVRPYWAEIEGLDDVAHRHENVHVYRFPYEPGISLPRLVLESLCVVLPFRRLTINPQLAIAESLAAGAPVVATDLRSTPELITQGRNGELIPVGDAEAARCAIERIIGDRERALRMGRDAAVDLRMHWNWDHTVEQTLAVYESCLARRGGAG